jgi:peroxiredoxin
MIAQRNILDDMPTIQAEPGVTRLQAQADAHLAMTAAAAAASKTLRAGASVPWFVLDDAHGQSVSLESLLSVGPVVLHFVRGGWCRFGADALTRFSAHAQDIAALGASAVVIAPRGEPSLHSGPPVCQLVDGDLQVMRAFGLAFELPTALHVRYRALGYVPPRSHGRETWLVPIPAVYLIDRDGTAVLVYIDIDYRNSFDMQTVLSALDALRSRHPAHGRKRGTALWEKHRADRKAERRVDQN